MDSSSCRICLSPNSAFVHVFGKFHKHSVQLLIESIVKIEINRNISLPQYICEFCITRLLQAESIINTCKKNNEFLNDLLSASTSNNLTEQVIHEEEVEDEEGIFLESLEEFNKELKELKELKEVKNSRRKSGKIVHYCQSCNSQFSTKKSLIHHQSLEHKEIALNYQEIKPYICDRCGVKFKQKSHVMNHLNVVHLKIKRYKCNLCNFGMYSKTHYTIHMKSHSNIREFVCEQCDKAFARKETLNVHMKTHAGLRPYACKFCTKTYTAHTDLKRHLFQHTNKKPYQCNLCDAEFFLKRQLFEHVAAQHPGKDTSHWLNGKSSWRSLMK